MWTARTVNRGHGIPLSQQFVAEVGQHIEQHGILHTAAGLEQSLDAEDQEPVGGDIGGAVEEFTFRTFAHGVQS